MSCLAHHNTPISPSLHLKPNQTKLHIFLSILNFALLYNMVESNNNKKKNHNPESVDYPPNKRPLHHPESDDNITLLPKETTILGVLPSTENKNFISAKAIAPPNNITKRSKVNQDDESDEGETKKKKKLMKMMGRPISGVVDGVFDAGYMMSVRIGGSDSIYRGVVFAPGLVVPPTVPGYKVMGPKDFTAGLVNEDIKSLK